MEGPFSQPYFGAAAPLFSGQTNEGGGFLGLPNYLSGPNVFGSGSGFSGTDYQGFGGYGTAGGGGGGGVGLAITGAALRAFGGSGNPAAMIGPGGTSGFAGPLSTANRFGGRFAGLGANLGTGVWDWTRPGPSGLECPVW